MAASCPGQVKQRGLWREISGYARALLSFEALFLAYMFAGTYKASALFSHVPVDMTIVMGVLSGLVGMLIIWQRWRRGERLPRRALVVAGVGLLFFAWPSVSLLWTPGEVYARQKALYVLVLNTWGMLGAALVIGPEPSRLRRFFAIWAAWVIFLAGAYTLLSIPLGLGRNARPGLFGANYQTVGVSLGYGLSILLAEGIAAERICRVGNVMIDTLVCLLPRALEGDVLQRLQLEGSRYAVLTMHRPGNVDDETTLARLLEALSEIGHDVPVVFPVHPRTRQRLTDLGVSVDDNAIRMIEPLGYLDFLALQSQARLVLTDSGGIQEETSYLGVPCLTMRPNTERPITVEMGTNQLVGRDAQRVLEAARDVLSGATCWDHRPVGGIPLWDGRAGERIADLLQEWCQ